jgi:glutamine---fructose-6-phosphate transaminase (isomerizing)
MCGIIGFTGSRSCAEILLSGLRRLEYRGYDSAGIAVTGGDGLRIVRRAGRVADLEGAITPAASAYCCGIGHTRWATHGGATESNAHPHRDCGGTVAVAHNGIIDNHTALRRVLEAQGHRFTSETDTEVLPHLIERFYGDGTPLETAVASALAEVQGTYGIVVVSAREPEKIVAARRGSPLVVMPRVGETFVASDAHAIGDGGGVILLRDDEIAVLTPGNARILDPHLQERSAELEDLNLELMSAEKGDFPHFMLKEIHEQPQVLEDTLRGRMDLKEGIPVLGGLREVETELRRARRVMITACGTSWHAGLVAKYMIESCARIPVEVDYASEFRYRNPVITADTLVLVISQSGETADTLAALREARTKGACVIGVCNVPGSSIARETRAGVFTHAGPEIGVASTKAFVCQVAVLGLIATLLGRQRELGLIEGARNLEAMRAAPDLIRAALATEPQVRRIAAEFAAARNFLYLGRGLSFPLALEGALKLKEISYIHAEGYPAAEMKHGPIALIDEQMPVVFIAPRDHTREKILSNIQEVRARGGKVIAICTEGDDEVMDKAHATVELPAAPEMALVLAGSVPLQLLAYHIAVLNGRDVDKPRNLAKSVTVE